MKLYLHDVADGENVINKALGVGVEIDIFLRGGFDPINPIIHLQNIDGINYADYNYINIPELNRFYFIDEIEIKNGVIFSLICSCDVLETYKAEILQSNARLRRNIKTGDYYNGAIDATINKSVMIYNGDVTLNSDVSNLIVSVVGG